MILAIMVINDKTSDRRQIPDKPVSATKMTGLCWKQDTNTLFETLLLGSGQALYINNIKLVALDFLLHIRGVRRNRAMERDLHVIASTCQPYLSARNSCWEGWFRLTWITSPKPSIQVPGGHRWRRSGGDRSTADHSWKGLFIPYAMWTSL